MNRDQAAQNRTRPLAAQGLHPGQVRGNNLTGNGRSNIANMRRQQLSKRSPIMLACSLACSSPLTSAIVNAPAFAFHNRPLVHHTQRLKRKALSYKTFDQIENDDIISLSPSNPSGDQGDEAKIESSDDYVEDDHGYRPQEHLAHSSFGKRMPNALGMLTCSDGH